MKYSKIISAFLTIVTLSFFVGAIFLYGSYHASERALARKNTIFSGSVVPLDYSKRVDRIVERLQNEDYGFAYAPWNRLMLHGFLASAIGSITRMYPEDQAFRSKAMELMSVSYKAVDSDAIRSSFSESGTIVPYGIIYQAWRLKILEQLALLDPEKYQDTFFSGCDSMAGFLLNSPRFTAESYTGWGWYVDNADAYHALWRADVMREKIAQHKRYTELIWSWTGELATHVGPIGLPFAEAYRPWYATDIQNQVRGSATWWLLWDLYDIDPDLAKKFFVSFEREFTDSWGKYTLVRDVSRSEKKINDIFDGPKLGPYSSSATILSVPIFRALSGYDESDGLLRSFDALLIAPSLETNAPDWLFWGSLLLDVLRLWAEVAKPT